MSDTYTAEWWARDPIIRRYGGLLTERNSSEAQWRQRDRLQYVFEQNKVLLDGQLVNCDASALTLLVTRSAESNALAYRTADARAVIVHIGLLERLWSLIVRAAHAPTVLSGNTQFTPSEMLEGDSPSDDPAMWSLPRERVEYFLHVHLFMLEYIVLHEIAHHDRGHLELAVSNSVSSLHNERVERAKAIAMDRSDAVFASRDLEFDADVYSADLALSTLDAQFPFEDCQWEEEAPKHLFLYVFAHLLVAQQLGGQVPPNVAPSASHSHPAPVYRAINYSNLLTHAFHRVGGGMIDAYSEAHDEAWTEASFVAELSGETEGIWHGENFAPGLLERFLVDERLGHEAVARFDALLGLSRE